MRKLTTTILLAGIAGAALAQTSSREIKGDKLFATYAYADAADKYSRVETLSPDGYRKLAVAYTNVDKRVEAEQAYQKFVNTSTNPDDFFNYAMVLKSNGKYETADMWMQRFSVAKPNDLRTKDYVANGSKLIEWLKDAGRYNVKHLSINTDQDDFGPTYFKDKIVFASSRDNSPMVDRTYNWTDKSFLDIYMADNENGELKNVKTLDGDINKKWHEGPASFSNNGTFMAFTHNSYDEKSKEGVVKFEIYFREWKGNKWTNEKPFKLNNAEYSVGHPCLSEEGNTMYFASDMPGGLGGSDIYRVTKDANGEWGIPENLGNAVNTEGNEMFPFYEPKSNVLFFASNGLVGLGGLDLFMSPSNSGMFSQSTNMGASVNSSQDDFGLILNGDLQKGFFSSNRNGGAGGDDLYSIDVLKPIKFTKQVSGIVKNKSGNAITYATVSVTDGIGKTNTIQTNAQGMFTFEADNNQSYTIKGSAEKYTDATVAINTGVPDAVIHTELVLGDPAPVIRVGVDLAKVVPNMKAIYFDLAKYNIRPDAAIELDKIVNVMNENPTMVVALGSHTDCRGTKEANQKLSNARAKSSAEYIRKYIVNPDRISGKGYGESKLINDCGCEGSNKSNCTEEEHQQNRRTEFIVVKM